MRIVAVVGIVVLALSIFPLYAGADDSLQDQLSAAVKAKNLEKFKELVRAGASPLGKDSKGKMPLEYIKNKKQAAAWAEEWGRMQAEISIREMERRATAGTEPPPTPPDPKLVELCEACNKGALDKVRIMVEQGANLHGTCPIASCTPLSWAAFRGHYPIVTLLLDKGADVNFRQEITGRTALFDAVRGRLGPDLFGHPDLTMKVAELLILRGADVNAGDAVGFTPLMQAASDGDLEMVLFLLKNGANINARTSYEHRTALSVARKKAHLEVVRALLDLGAK